LRDDLNLRSESDRDPVARFLPAPATGIFLPGNPGGEMKKKILLADDDESVRKMVGRVLESESYEVLLAKTGREAVAQALSGQPDLILLDLTMPERDGWQALDLIERIRPLVPVIVITARPNQQDHCKAAGVDTLMEKPLDLPVMLRTIGRLLDEADRKRAGMASLT
jgi:CheY-like chemotaxis protein